jgi:hypothetical protein
MVKRIAVAGALLGALVLFRPAPAEANFSFSLWLPGLAVSAGPPCPLPVAYVPPPPVYYPAYAPVAPVVYVRGGYHHHHSHYRGHGHRHGHRHHRRGW